MNNYEWEINFRKQKYELCNDIIIYSKQLLVRWKYNLFFRDDKNVGYLTFKILSSSSNSWKFFGLVSFSSSTSISFDAIMNKNMLFKLKSTWQYVSTTWTVYFYRLPLTSGATSYFSQTDNFILISYLISNVYVARTENKVEIV